MMIREKKWSSALGIALLSWALSPTADAADGRLEINQACVAAGCFSGDDPGSP
jgi:hypothetical protein